MTRMAQISLINTIIYIIFIILFGIIIILFINYYYGKRFKSCKTCIENEIFYINVLPPSNDLINELKITLTNNSSKLNPKLNFNNAKGTKSNYDQLPLEVIEFYENNYFKDQVSAAVGEEVFYADKKEQYRIFARIYKKGDFLEWHYDNNFTIGNRYTLVIPVLVENNTSEFMIKDRRTGEEKVVPVRIGKGVIYNGSITYHKISEQMDGIRMVIIIPFYSNPKKTFFGEIREIIRNKTDKYLTL